MTKEDLIAMAREAGFPVSWTQGHSDGDEILTRFASLVSARTREECAKVVLAEHLEDPQDGSDDAYDCAVNDCAAAIRAMGERT